MCRRLALLAFVGPLSGLWPIVAASQGVTEIDACIRRNLPARASIQTVSLTAHDRSGESRELRGKIYWQRTEKGHNQMMAEVEAPPADRGSRYLFLERESGSDTFVFLPELGKKRRIHPRSASGSLFGTDFSYEDIEHVRSISGGESAAERLPDAEVGGRQVSVVAVSPAPESESAYRRIVYFVDAETCVILKIEFYGSGERPDKVMDADPAAVTKEGEGWVPRHLQMRNLVADTRSELRVDEIELDPKIPEKIFSAGYLERGR